LRLLCSCARARVAQHSRAVDPTDLRNSKTIRKLCPARVVVHLGETGLYFFSTIILDHNHVALVDGDLPYRAQPNDDQKQLVEELSALRSITRRDVHTLLKARFPDHPLTAGQVSNMMNNAKLKARRAVQDLGGDMVATVGLLLKKKEEDPRWVVHVEVDTATNRFRRLFWMSPEQRELAIRFGDVIINDISLMRNQYNVPLNIWIVIDHQCKSRNIAYALHTTESAEDHEWVVNILFEVLTPNPNRFYFSDFDLAIDKVLSTKDVTHGLCLHHLAGNITKSLGPALGALFQSFVAAFCRSITQFHLTTSS
jgi:hypothetical protein